MTLMPGSDNNASNNSGSSKSSNDSKHSKNYENSENGGKSENNKNGEMGESGENIEDRSSKRDSGIILVTGGVRSGKSTFAEQRAAEAARCGQTVTYIATADAGDDEMKRRIEEHRRRRPAHFTTAEERYHPARILLNCQDPAPFFLLDCLTLLLTNHLLRHWKGQDDPGVYREGAREALQAVADLLQAVETSPGTLLVVTNEVGMGVVPEHPMARVFRDLAGQANQQVAAAASEVWFSVCGITRRWK